MTVQVSDEIEVVSGYAALTRPTTLPFSEKKVILHTLPVGIVLGNTNA